MNTPANAGDDFEQRLHHGAVLRLTLDKATLDDPDIDKRSKYVIVVSALLPDEDVPAHLVKIDVLMKASVFLSPEDKR